MFFGGSDSTTCHDRLVKRNLLRGQQCEGGCKQRNARFLGNLCLQASSADAEPLCLLLPLLQDYC